MSSLGSFKTEQEANWLIGGGSTNRVIIFNADGIINKISKKELSDIKLLWKHLDRSLTVPKIGHWSAESCNCHTSDGGVMMVDCGIDEPVLIVNPSNKKELHISSDVVRVHKAFKRKEIFWKAGQKIKILKGACAGFHNNNVYATLEYILLEGFQGMLVKKA
ncbi:hypothetical protein L1987_18670 [Smallanthus sonchifolius]|uniref:Uncharacterized protein n=1 Tax=Smallanthus sonchifolius TaxID=185202 RepID=A0ACB9J2Z3_9ASTR|nr:hypothetical protein L1987_18670 [Smallanthus sonchifolius]